MFGAAVANGLYSVPFYQVVNVNLSVSVFMAYAGVALSGIALIVCVLTGAWRGAFSSVVGVLLSLLLPFAPIAAYQVYGWLGGLAVSGDSFVYDNFMSLFATAAKAIASTFGQLTIELPKPGSTGKALELIFGLKLETFATIISMAASLIAVINFFMPQKPIVIFAGGQRTR
jgi:hypothetical protein